MQAWQLGDWAEVNEEEERERTRKSASEARMDQEDLILVESNVEWWGMD